VAALSGAAATAAAEAWEWANFVRANYLLYARLLSSIAQEVKANRFVLTCLPNEGDQSERESRRRAIPRDHAMLKEVAALFDTPHLLPLLGQLGEATDQLLQSQLPDSSPLYPFLIEQCHALEGNHVDSGVSAALYEALRYCLPANLYGKLDLMGEHLKKKIEEIEAAQKQKGLFDSASSAASREQKEQLKTLQQIKACAERALRELQPAGHVKAQVAQHAPESILPSVIRMQRQTLDRSLDTQGRSLRPQVAAGQARCSVLDVPFRATPRLTARPAGTLEVGFLVGPCERLGGHVPDALKEIGLHPRILASVPFLCILGALQLLFMVMPVGNASEESVDRAKWVLFVFYTGLFVAGGSYFNANLSALALTLWVLAWSVCALLCYYFVTISWWVLHLSCIFFGWVYFRHWQKRHAPSQSAAPQSWVPWLAEQMARGTPISELRDYLERALPTADGESEPTTRRDRREQRIQTWLEQARKLLSDRTQPHATI
jgi:hypothetical protein